MKIALRWCWLLDFVVSDREKVKKKMPIHPLQQTKKKKCSQNRLITSIVLSILPHPCISSKLLDLSHSIAHRPLSLKPIWIESYW